MVLTKVFQYIRKKKHAFMIKAQLDINLLTI